MVGEDVRSRVGRGVPCQDCGVRTKYCGITRLDDAEHAVRIGAWAIGLNHWHGSPRYCEPAAAAEIGAAMHRRLEVVGVFVNASLAEIAHAAEANHLSLLQLHGDEGLAFCLEAGRRTGCRVIKALPIATGADIDRARSFRVDFHLLDAHSPGRRGGTGETFDWSLLRRRRSRVPMILAGGLVPDNVAEAIEAARPWAVDTASGTERAPGMKDHNLMSDFQRRADEQGGPSGRKPVSEPDHFRESRERDAERRAAEAAERAAEAEAEASEVGS